MEFFIEYQRYLYLGFVIFLCLFLYGYFFHMYNSKKNGGVDYEKYSNLALDDDYDSKIIEERRR